MNRSKFFNQIEESLSFLALRITSRGQLNLLDLHTHAENFYRDFLAEVYGWSLENANSEYAQAEAIDLIDTTNCLVIQVSSTATKQKIESSLAKKTLQNYKGYRFKFVSIATDAGFLRKMSFKNPHGISFTPADDIIDTQSLLYYINQLETAQLERINVFLRKEIRPEGDPSKRESNLAHIIHLLSKQDWEGNPLNVETKSFEIERKITYNHLHSAQHFIHEYAIFCGQIDKIYSEYDANGANKSSSVLAAIRNEYLKVKDVLKEDELFFRIVEKIDERVENSANINSIPVEEIELCIYILVVDAFIRCKIFENPENAPHATA